LVRLKAVEGAFDVVQVAAFAAGKALGLGILEADGIGLPALEDLAFLLGGEGVVFKHGGGTTIDLPWVSQGFMEV
jgi:hypothetical protein